MTESSFAFSSSSSLLLMAPTWPEPHSTAATPLAWNREHEFWSQLCHTLTMEPETSPLTAPPLPRLQDSIAKALLSTRHLQGDWGQVTVPHGPRPPTSTPPHLPRGLHQG